VRARTLVAFGGAAPLHAARVAEKLGIDRVLIPANAGVGSAVGFLRAPVAYEIVRTNLQRLGAFDAETANRILGEMRQAAEAIVRQGAGDATLSERRSAFMRYKGQGHEIAVELPARTYTAADGAMLREAFEAAYRALYRRTIPGVDIELLSWVLTVSGPISAVDEKPAALAPSRPAPARHRRVFDPLDAEFREVPIYYRKDLAPGAAIAGPAVIVEDETSTVVSPRFDAMIDGFGYIEMRRRAGS
jgi:N-methylhydantoinase A